MKKYSALSLVLGTALVLSMSGCSKVDEPYTASPFDTAKLKLVSGQCEYLNGDKKQTLCRFKLKVNHTNSEALDIKGKFKFDISTYDFQVRYAKYQEGENEGYLEVTADEVLGSFEGVIRTTDVIIDYSIDPLETKSYLVGVIVPTKTVIQSVSLALDKSGEVEFYPIGPAHLNVCTFGAESFSDSAFMSRGAVCDSGKVTKM